MIIFLKIDGIDGESQDAKHKGEIDLESFSWGESRRAPSHAGGGSGARQSQHARTSVHYEVREQGHPRNCSWRCANGEHIKKAMLVCRKAGKEQQEYLKCTFTDLLVSSYQTAGQSGGDGASHRVRSR